MDDCRPNILVDNETLSIAKCNCCNRIGLHYHNILAAFEKDEFIEFGEAILNIDFEEKSVVFPYGHPYVVINTCHHNIQFCFREKEFDEFQKIISEALIMLEVQQALTNE